jgi:tetratricopeptide (TPR) repeat protein
MLFKWLDAREATATGAALADDFYLQSASKLPRARAKQAAQGSQEPELQNFLEKFLQRVDQAAQPLKLNVFKRAKLANSFKWRLLEKGVERELVDELTQALVMRLMGTAVGRPTAESPPSRRDARAAVALHAAAHRLLGRGAFAEARESYQKLVNLDPRDAVARNGLGIALGQLARYGEAESEFRRAIAIRPGYPDAHYNLAGVLQSVGRFNESEMPLRRALKLKPSYLDARISLGSINILLGRLRDAKEDFEKVLRVAPRNARAMIGLGQVDALEGRFAEAEATYRRALEADPGASSAWAALVWIRKMTTADAAWVKRAEEFAEGGLTPIDEATMRFAIGKYYDDVADYPRAFRSYERANELHKLRAEPYDREGHTRFIDDLVRTRTRDAIASAAATGSDSERPVFVIGMPRSGTSLVEQIIASHADARGAGELNFWRVVARRHEETMRKELLAEPVRRKLAQDYLKVLAGHSGDAMRVVDKATVNADHLGVIHSIFPRARIINLQRDPVDTCLSCYFQQFPPSLNFTVDLSDLAHYYREHHRLMAHWRKVLPTEVFLDVSYDALTGEPEKWARRILEFIGLPWDERCLTFYETARAVNTASVWQVRQKIYRSSVGRSRNYQKFIGPLRGLADLRP